MCGIAGILNIEAASAIRREDLARMLVPLHHRGPDGQGFHVDGPVGLAHARLSIIDLAGGAQPIHNEDRTVWVTFNGEIFNYVELRADLERAGHRFYTHSDTEVLVHLYEEHGLDMVQHLNGQFAFAIWDTPKQRLLLVRDRVGILPLFYARDAGRLVFGSEIKAMLPVLSRAPQLNPVALDQVFTFWSVVGSNTMFAGVEQLPPGHLLVCERGRVEVKRYWDWKFPAQGKHRPDTVRELADELHALLGDATRIRLRADVPVGAYLSGGLDSTALVALMCEQGVKPQTFSLRFAERALDEGEYQQQAAQHFGVQHHSTTVDDLAIRTGFERAVWHAEAPILRCAPVPMMALSGGVHSLPCKVVLTGEGADEVFGGYDLFKEAKIRRFWARQPESKWRPLLLRRLYPYLDLTSASKQAYSEAFFGAGLRDVDSIGYAHAPRWQTTAQCKLFFSAELRAGVTRNCIDDFAATLPAEFGAWDGLERAQYIEAKTLLANYLLCSQGDRMLMANSVEGRFPFLDHRVIEFGNSLDPRVKMHVLNEKYIVKNAVGQLLPPAITQRTKQPYRAPDSQAFAADGIDFVERALNPGALRQSGYFDADKVQLLWRKVRAGRAVSYKDSMAFVGVLSTQLWHEQFVGGRQP